MKPLLPVGDMCQFCLSNGEPEEQCRSHQLKTADGLVSCPILRAFVCPHCKATGDYAHTQRYCPLNRDGKFNSHGASLADLKRKKNAAGRTVKSRWPQPSYPASSLPSPEPLLPSVTNSVTAKAVKSSSPGCVTKSPLHDEPLHLDQRPPEPSLRWQPPSFQLTLYRHYQYLQFYREKCMEHQNIIDSLAHLHAAALYAKAQPQVSSTLSPTDYRDKENVPGCDQLIEKMDGGSMDLDLDQLLAELREGTEEFEA